jgi:HlyD family secretion protein
MFGKKQAVKWTVIFFIVVVVCTFTSKTIYYFTLPKVSVEKPKPGTFADVTVLTQGTIEVKGALSHMLELPVPVRVDEVFVKKG